MRFACTADSKRTPRIRKLEKMVNELDRPGKLDGKGFYDYPEGAKAHLWPGLKEQFPAREAIPFQDMQERMLFAEAIEGIEFGGAVCFICFS